MLNKAFSNSKYELVMKSTGEEWKKFCKRHPNAEVTVEEYLQTPIVRYAMEHTYLVLDKTQWPDLLRRTLMLMYGALTPRLIAKLSEICRYETLCGVMALAIEYADPPTLEQLSGEHDDDNFDGTPLDEFAGNVVNIGDLPIPIAEALDMRVPILHAACEKLAYCCYPTNPLQGLAVILNNLELPFSVHNAIVEAFQDDLDEDFEPSIAS